MSAQWECDRTIYQQVATEFGGGRAKQINKLGVGVVTIKVHSLSPSEGWGVFSLVLGVSVER